MSNDLPIPKLRRVAASALLLIVSACTTSPHPISPTDASAVSTTRGSDADAAVEIANLMSGKFITEPAEGGSTFSDQRVILQQGPTAGVWLYYQLNTGEESKLYRQRFMKLTALSQNRVIQHTYQPTKPEQWDSIWNQAGASLVLTEADIESAFEPGCELVWTRTKENQWRGYVNPETCEYFSERRGKTIYIEGESMLSENMLKQTERGFDADGGQLFGTEPGEFLQLRRVQ